MERFRPVDRLRNKSQFDAVFRGGRRVNTPPVSLVIRKTGLDQNRLGISVSRKAGSAVRRNQLKRWIREVFRRNRGSFPPSADIVVVVSRPVAALFGDLRKALLEGAARVR
ncbi:MAG: ribonuclease P protein component [Acidobacteriota bacterium]